MKLIDTASMKEAERRTDAAGLSYYQMMENAGQAAFSLLAAAMVVGIWQPALLQQLIDQIVSL